MPDRMPDRMPNRMAVRADDSFEWAQVRLTGITT